MKDAPARLSLEGRVAMITGAGRNIGRAIALGLAAEVGRRGRPREVAAMVRYLASEEAAFVTGQTLNINGGLYL